MMTCSACGKSTEIAEYQSFLPENGWVMEYETFGYYSGFSDDIEPMLDNRISKKWFMCHDCVVKFLETFPMLGETVHKGGHSIRRDKDNSKPCCNWAWRISDAGIVQEAKDGEWIDTSVDVQHL